VNRRLGALLAANGGILAREDAALVVDHDVLDRAVRAGRLLRPYPGVLLDPGLAGDRDAVIRAAVLYTRGHGAISHLTGLRLWQLPGPDTGPVHLMTPPASRLRGARGLVVHRREDLVFEPPEVVVRAGCPVLRLEQCIVDSWPRLDTAVQRAPAIRAIAQRMTTPDRLRAALDTQPRLGGRRHLAHLIDLLAAGCRSELELWGYAHVFSGLRLRWQVRLPMEGRAVYLDVYDEATRVNFELDGRQYHGSVQDRERDLRRDALLAARGIMVVRFTHDRLRREPAEVRRQVLAILASRRADRVAA
jgi:very-short-patch-repair endonuclease